MSKSEEDKSVGGKFKVERGRGLNKCVSIILFLQITHLLQICLASMAAEVQEGVHVRDMELKLLQLVCTVAFAEKEPCSFST